jgi:hypothetical protein
MFNSHGARVALCDHPITITVDCCRLLVVVGRDFLSALQPLWLIVLSPDESECDRVINVAYLYNKRLNFIICVSALYDYTVQLLCARNWL